MRGARSIGWGAALPEKVVTNDDLATELDTSDAWITERTGIRERRIGGTTSSLAAEAAQQALDDAGVAPEEVGLLVLATSTPDQTMPPTAATVQHALGLRCGAFDLNAACSGWVYAHVTGHMFVRGGVETVLVIGADTMSRITDWTDRNTAVLFADGAGAAVLRASAEGDELLSWDLGSEGSGRHLLACDIGGTITMDGREVFRRAVRIVVESAARVLDQAGVRPEEVALFVPHQANVRIIDAAAERLGIDPERTTRHLETVGNTSAASIPLALVDARDAGRLADGDLVLSAGFGAGMTWATALTRWAR